MALCICFLFCFVLFFLPSYFPETQVWTTVPLKIKNANITWESICLFHISLLKLMII